MSGLLVVKVGGGAGVNLQLCADDIAAVARSRRVVVVHGVSDAMAQLSAQRGINFLTLRSPSGHDSRYTNPETRDLYVEACQQVNAELVAALQTRGINAQGLTVERVPLWGERKDAIRAVVDGRVRIIRDDYSGIIRDVRALPALEVGHVAVVPPMANSADGFLNVDGDRAGAAIAAALCADEYVILSNVRGLYRQFGDENSFVQQVQARELDQALSWAEGRMKRKVIGAQEAINGGVRRVIIADGRIEQPISAALNGQGTVFSA